MPPKKTTKTPKKATRARKQAPMTRAHKQAPMTRAHKQALARGRNDSRAVSRYLEALDAGKPRPGRPRTIQSVQTQLKAVETRVKGAQGIDRLLALQQRADLRAALAQRNDKVDLAAAERAFVKAARGYGERKGIAYATWREAGVSPSVLAKARIARTST